MARAETQTTDTTEDTTEDPQARRQPLRLHAEQCTAYLLGSFGYRMHELREIDVRVARFAQYDNALRIEWVAKGKRTRMGTNETTNPSLIVLQGHGHLPVGDWMSAQQTDSVAGLGVARTSQSRWTCWAPEWREDFERTHAGYIASKVVLADYRGFDVTGGGRLIQLQQGGALNADDRVMTRRGAGVIVQVKRADDGSTAEAFKVRLDYPLRNAVGRAKDEARLWWIPAVDCRWEGAENASEVAP